MLRMLGPYNQSVSEGNNHPPQPDPQRLLGLDVGSKTIGLAVSDPLGITAQGLETIRRKNRRTDFALLDKVIERYEVKEIVVGYPLRLSGATNKRSDLGQLTRIIRQYRVSEIVVGYPLRMSGEAGAQAEKIAAFAEDLRQRFSLPVHLWDERLSSAEANRVLRETEMSIRRRGQGVDRIAAVLILQSFMESRRSSSR